MSYWTRTIKHGMPAMPAMQSLKFKLLLFLLLAGFTDPLSAYSNTRAFLDYRVMGFRECVAEVARYMTNVEGLDMKDPMRVRVLNHLENYLTQRELAINAAVAASAQMGLPKLSPPTTLPPAGIAIQHAPGPFVPIPTQRASPDGNLSPPTTFALPTPVISFAPTTATVPVFGAAHIATPTAHPPIISLAKIEAMAQVPPGSPTKKLSTSTSSSPSATKQPFRPWADPTDDD